VEADEAIGLPLAQGIGIPDKEEGIDDGVIAGEIVLVQHGDGDPEIPVRGCSDEASDFGVPEGNEVLVWDGLSGFDGQQVIHVLAGVRVENALEIVGDLLFRGASFRGGLVKEETTRTADEEEERGEQELPVRAPTVSGRRDA
jgi:hypothetical protein